MGGICGWTGLATADRGGVIDAMRRELTRHDGSRGVSLHGTHSALGAADLSYGVAHHQDETGGLAACVGSARWTGDGPASGPVTGAGLLAAFRTMGPAMLRHLQGHFALAIIDEQAATALIATDRIGVVPMVVAPAPGGGLVFGSTSSAINAHPQMAPEIRVQALFDYLYFHVTPGPGRAYRGHHWLLPGHYAHLRDGELTIERYWMIEYVEDQRDCLWDLQARFRDLLKQSIARASDGVRAGAFLSGGTDSSTVAGMLGQVVDERPRTYSIGFDAPGYDEMEYARISARHFRTDHHEYYVTADDVLAVIPQIASIYDAPFGNSSAAPAYFCARMARADGVERLLGGDGGDELFGGNQRYATQTLFEWYGSVPAPLRKGVIEPLVALPGLDRLWPVRKAASYVRQARLPMPQRMQTYNILHRLGLDAVLTEAFRAAVDIHAPERHEAEIYHAAHAGSLLNRMLALDLKITLADNDLPKVARMCELAQVGVAFPLLDDDLVAFSATLEPRIKLKGLKLRWFFKEALRGFLPDETLTKSKQGFGLPFGLWVKQHAALGQLAGDSLTSLKTRGIIQPAFIDQLWNTYMAEHPGYYGPTVWVLMMLEQWLAHHAPHWRL